MCTFNMTFEVPESKNIDIEALKKQINAFVQVVTSMPNIEKSDKDTAKEQSHRLSADVAWFKNNPVVLSDEDLDDKAKLILER